MDPVLSKNIHSPPRDVFDIFPYLNLEFRLSLVIHATENVKDGKDCVKIMYMHKSESTQSKRA